MQKVITQPVISIEYKSQIWKGSFRESQKLSKKTVTKSKILFFRAPKLLEQEKIGRRRINK